ncbi:tripartite tricarboxylate transporter permease [Halomarina halobia]|nr:tripartite tricarboxylate transporter permease [Halomarina sp. PSR21]
MNLGIGMLFTQSILLAIILGTAIGIVFGAIPGFSATMTIVLLTPVTIPFEPAVALILLVSAYGGAVYGGSIPAILINTPGAPGSVVTCWDGYKLTQQGKAVYTLAVSAFASGLAGLIAATALLFAAPIIADIALEFGPPEMFLLAVFALTIIPAVKDASLSKGLLAGLFGLLIATVGNDPQLSRPRATFGVTILQSGFDYIVILIGLFVLTEMIRLAMRGSIIGGDGDGNTAGGYDQVVDGVRAVLSRPVDFLRATFIGTFVGSLPGAGADVANFVSYNEAQRWSSDEKAEQYGTGIIEGVIAADSSNNATQGGALMPTLTLGIPGSGSTAALIGALAIHGLNPGPGLFERSGPIVYAMIFSLFIGNLLIIVYGLSGSRYFGKVAYIPIRYIIPVVTVLSVIGAFAVRNSGFDLLIMLAAGILGILFVKYDYPLVSPVLGVIVGNIAETGFTRGWLLNGQNWVAFLTSSEISIGLTLLIVLSLGVTAVKNHA